MVCVFHDQDRSRDATHLLWGEKCEALRRKRNELSAHLEACKALSMPRMGLCRSLLNTMIDNYAVGFTHIGNAMGSVGMTPRC